MSIVGAGADALHRFPSDIVGSVFMLSSAAGFACAAALTLRGNAAAVAAAVIVMPWLIILTSIITRGVVGVPLMLVRVTDALPPRTFMDLSLRGVSHQLIYLGITGAIAIHVGDSVIAREQ
jgi:hypothetical protein